MANERAFLNRNTGTEAEPIWERWFAFTVADAVLMSDTDGETRTIKDYVNEQITTLIGGAPNTADTLKELFDLISSNSGIMDALNEAIAGKADKVHTHTTVTESAAGFMAAADKTKLNGIATSANNYVHPTTSGNKHIPTDGSKGQILRWESNGTAQWGEDRDTTYTTASTSDNGLMSNTDKAKLDGIQPGAQVNVIYTPVTEARDGLMSSDDKYKLNRIQSGANNYVHPVAHDPSIITQNSSNRFTTDAEKKVWNNKATVYFASSLPSSAPSNSICFLTK